MPKTVQIRDLDDEVYDGLVRRAAEAGISVPALLRLEATRRPPGRVFRNGSAGRGGAHRRSVDSRCSRRSTKREVRGRMLVVDASGCCPRCSSEGRLRSRSVVGSPSTSNMLRRTSSTSRSSVSSDASICWGAWIVRPPPQAVQDLADWPGERYGHRHLLDRAWQLRATVRGWDAMYVALAEALDAVLITTDRRLGAAIGPTCRIQVIDSGPPE